MKGSRTMVAVGGALIAAATLPATAQLGVASGVASPLAGRGVVSGTRASGLTVHSRRHATLPSFRRHRQGHNLRLRFGHRFRPRHFHIVHRKHGSRFKLGFGHKHFLRLPFFRPHVFPVVSSLVVVDTEPSIRDKQVPTSRVTLLALKGGTIYAAAAYWLEEGEIFYVTPDGREDSFPFDELDWEVTVNLNAERGVGLLLRPVTRVHAPRMPSRRQGSRHIPVPVKIAKN